MTVEPAPQTSGQALVALDRDHPGAGLGKGSGDRAVSGTEVEDEITPARAGGADKLRDQPAVTQKMGTGRVRRRWRPPWHGRP
jgi:hypothetical protein